MTEPANHSAAAPATGPVIGPYRLSGPVVQAPMAGITDAPFRRLCQQFGAALAATEMTLASHGIRRTAGRGSRLDFDGLPGLRVVQIAGSDPQQLATAAREAAELGAQIVDINMGCPAKKVCKKMAGSALLRDEPLVQKILTTVVAASPVPVTLKMRTGTDPTHRNGTRIARIAEAAGISALAVHGRTRACRFKGQAEYATIRDIKAAVSIPVFANGDIVSTEQAAEVLQMTGADGVMIGRGSQGRPWIFSQIKNYLEKKVRLSIPSIDSRRDIIRSHLDAIYRFYGEDIGVRMAKKHLSWYCNSLPNADEFRARFVRAENSSLQMQLTNEFFSSLQ